MTRKDFVLIADIINSLNFDENKKEFIAKEFADNLKATNVAFDKQRFIEACMKK